MRVLVANGADVDARRHDRATPLFLAAHYRHAEAFDALLEAGADPFALGCPDDRQPMHLACAQPDNMAIVQKLLDLGQDVNLANAMGETPLLIASDRGLTEYCRLFIERGATLDTMRKRCGTCPLYGVAAGVHAGCLWLHATLTCCMVLCTCDTVCAAGLRHPGGDTCPPSDCCCLRALTLSRHAPTGCGPCAWLPVVATWTWPRSLSRVERTWRGTVRTPP